MARKKATRRAAPRRAARKKTGFWNSLVTFAKKNPGTVFALGAASGYVLKKGFEARPRPTSRSSTRSTRTSAATARIRRSSTGSRTRSSTTSATRSRSFSGS